jgi:hypothetical protein
VLLRLFFLAFILKKFGFSLGIQQLQSDLLSGQTTQLNSADRQKTNVKLKRKIYDSTIICRKYRFR